jgi:hypothetical protein
MKKRLSESKIIKILLLSFILTAVLSFGIMQIVASPSPAPGSNQDPIVTKSYVDAKIAEALANYTGTPQGTTTGDTSTFEAKLTEIENDLRDLEREYNYSSLAVAGAIEKTVFSVVQASKGQKLLLGEGTEIILRAGNADAVSGPGGDLSNLTTGVSIANGTKIDQNHLILSSREDGRGLAVISDTIWVMIKGSYKVQ